MPRNEDLCLRSAREGQISVVALQVRHDVLLCCSTVVQVFDEACMVDLHRYETFV